MMKNGFVVGKIVFDDGIDIFSKDFSDLIFLSINLILYSLDDIFLLLGLILDILLYTVYELIDPITHQITIL